MSFSRWRRGAEVAIYTVFVNVALAVCSMILINLYYLFKLYIQ